VFENNPTVERPFTADDVDAAVAQLLKKERKAGVPAER
jgi:hypothetical protein